MKLKILKTELIVQIIVISACLIWWSSQLVKSNSSFVVLYILLFLAISNIIGFLVRVFTYHSKLMIYYFFIVIFYLPSLFLISFVTEEFTSIFFKIYLVGGSLLISLFYTVFGFYIIKKLQLDIQLNKQN